MGNKEITKKFSRLKSVSSIDDDYLKKLFLKTFKYLQEKNCVGILFSKVAGLPVYRKETPTLVFSFSC